MINFLTYSIYMIDNENSRSRKYEKCVFYKYSDLDQIISINIQVGYLYLSILAILISFFVSVNWGGS